MSYKGNIWYENNFNLKIQQIWDNLYIFPMNIGRIDIYYGWSNK